MLKIGLIGCGFMGGMHAACYNAIEGAELVAVADVRREKAEKIANGKNIEIYATGMELIANADVDVIDICLPTYLHTEHAVAAMKKVKNVFIEKPVCMSKEEGELLLATEKETGANVQVGQVIRLWDEYVWLKEQADKKVFGEIKTAAFRRLSSKPTWAWDGWLHDAARSGSMALDLHIHDVDFMRYLMGGEPDAIVSKEARNTDGLIEHIFTTFTYGAVAISVEACWSYPAGFPFTAEFIVEFEKATVVNDLMGLIVYPVDGGCEKIDLAPSIEGDNEIGGNISSLGGYYNELKYFVDKITAGEALTIAPLCEGVKSVELVLSEIASVGGAQNNLHPVKSMNEKICFYTPPFPRVKSYFDMVDVSVEHGLKYIEGFNVLDFQAPDTEVAKKIREYANSKGIGFSCFSVYINLVGDDRAEMLEKLKGYARVAAVLGSPYLHHTIANDFMNPDNVVPYKEEFFKRGINAVREIYDYAQSLGVRTAYEEQGYLFNGLQGYKKFLDEVNRDVGVVADFANICQAGEKIEDFINAFSEKIVHAHIKDVVLNNEQGATGLKTLVGSYMHEAVIGTGDVNIKRGIELLKATGYTGCYGIEYGAPDDNSSIIKESLSYVDSLL